MEICNSLILYSEKSKLTNSLTLLEYSESMLDVIPFVNLGFLKIAVQYFSLIFLIYSFTVASHEPHFNSINGPAYLSSLFNDDLILGLSAWYSLIRCIPHSMSILYCITALAISSDIATSFFSNLGGSAYLFFFMSFKKSDLHSLRGIRTYTTAISTFVFLSAEEKVCSIYSICASRSNSF